MEFSIDLLEEARSHFQIGLVGITIFFSQPILLCQGCYNEDQDEQKMSDPQIKGISQDAQPQK
jgi:hypothetical protein